MTTRDSERKLEPSQFINTDDPLPESPNVLVEDQQLTVRAVVVSCILGGIIAASNIYIGLKTGFSFGAGLFGAMLGFAILKTLSKTAPTSLGGLFRAQRKQRLSIGCYVSRKHRIDLHLGFPCCISARTVESHPKDDVGRLITFTLCCAFFGLSFTQPLRKFYILKLKLVFPAGVAAAYTIHSLYIGRTAEASARKKTKALIYSFIGAIIFGSSASMVRDCLGTGTFSMR
ncbi:OPT oligopeptide transporter protein-domain-containing protein [Suillus ampliporus]|nr:OPT oligopeptide transporter protein-domain-containing protein [Suillus ampliporus]